MWASARPGLAASAGRSAAVADVPVGRGHRRGGEVEPGLELAQRLVELARPQVGDAEVDVDGGGGREQRDRALQARAGPREIARLAERHSEERMGVAGGGIEDDAPPQLGDGLVAAAAVPERDTQAVVGLGGFGLEGDRALEVGERRGEVSLLAEHEAQQAVRVGVALVQAQGLDERVARGGELAALGGCERALVGFVGGARRIARAGRLRSSRRAEALCCRSAMPSA